MKKMVLLFVPAILILFTSRNLFSQGVGIGPTSFTPNASAGLHVNFNDRGLLIPQVDLITELTTLEAGAHGLLVYNTNDLAYQASGLYVNRSWTTTPDWRKVSTDLSGSGIATRVAFWSSPTTLANNSDLYWDNVNNRLGIGTTTPAQRLTINGNLEISSTSGASSGTIYKTGGYRYIHDYGNYNNFFGFNAGNFTLTGESNIGIGDDVLSVLSTGTKNTAIGDYSMPLTTTGIENVALGASALEQNTEGSFNIAIGKEAMKGNTKSCYNIAIGTTALQAAASNPGDLNTFNIAIGGAALYATSPTNMNNGRKNLAIGHESLRSNTIGYSNIALGYKSIYSNISASTNIAIGESALYSINNGAGTEATINIAIGYEALYMTAPTSYSTGRRNIGIGYMALRSNTTGSYNTAIGYFALRNADNIDNIAIGDQALCNTNSGSGNTAVGNYALANNLTGSNNVAIGLSADVSGTNQYNSIAIGYYTSASSSNEVRLGNSNIQSLYCQGAYYSTTGNAANLYVNSSGQIMRSTSSARYKKEITDLEISSAKIYQLQPVSFTGISDNQRHFGLIAEEVAATIPELVEYAKESQVIPGSLSDRMIPENVQYPLLSVLLLKEVQKHEERIRQLEQKLAEKDEIVLQVLEELKELKAMVQPSVSK